MVKKEIKIVFNVTSFEGDEEYSLLPKEAVKKIKSLVILIFVKDKLV